MSGPCSPRLSAPCSPGPMITFSYKENLVSADSPLSSPQQRRQSSCSPLTSRNFKTLSPESTLNTSPLPIINLTVPPAKFKGSTSFDNSPKSYSSVPNSPQPVRPKNNPKTINPELLASLLNKTSLDFEKMIQNLESSKQPEIIKKLLNNKAKFVIGNDAIIDGLKKVKTWVEWRKKQSFWGKLNFPLSYSIAVINDTSDQGGVYFLLKPQKNEVGKCARIKPAVCIDHRGNIKVVAWRSLNEIHCTESEKQINEKLANHPQLRPHVIAGNPIPYNGNWTPRDVQTDEEKKRLKEFNCPKVGFPLEYGMCFLDDFLSSKPSFGLALNRMTHLVKGLELLHSIDIVHRDIKPENIVISEDGLPKYIDWGNSQPEGYPVCNPGTFGFCAPELYKKTPIQVEFSQDVYSLGMTLLCMLTENNWIREGITERAINENEKENYFKEIKEYYGKNKDGFAKKDIEKVIQLLRSCLENKSKYRIPAAELYKELISIVPKTHKNSVNFS